MNVVETGSTHDDPRAPDAGIALCLSGGGYRAMLSHLGSLWRLNELGYLPRLARVSSVSGGSIVAGVLGLNWKRLAFGGDGVGAAFGAQVVEPVRALASKTIDEGAIVGGLFTPGSISDKVIAAYRKHLFGDATLQDLPPDPPRFVINATNVQSGALFRFSRPFVADYRIGLIRNPKIEIAVAVAASSAFPPVLSPLRLELSASDWEPTVGRAARRPAPRTVPHRRGPHRRRRRRQPLDIAATKTRLKRLDDGTQERIINWGYAICDAAMRRWVETRATAPASFPYPGGVG